MIMMGADYGMQGVDDCVSQATAAATWIIPISVNQYG